MEFKVPKKYQHMFGELKEEMDLIEECKYKLYFKPGYAWLGEYPYVPVRSKKEALKYLSEGEKVDDEENNA